MTPEILIVMNWAKEYRERAHKRFQDAEERSESEAYSRGEIDALDNLLEFINPTSDGT